MTDEGLTDLPADNYGAFLVRFNQNQKVTGFGLGNVFIHSACPFCAAPDFMVFELMDQQRVMQLDHKCAECERSGKFLVDRLVNNISFRFVQTGGPDLPSWMPYTLERVTTP